MLAVVALGGNAILRRGEQGTYDEQRGQVAIASASLAELEDRGVSLVVTHGNGPQVGRLLLQNIAARRTVPPMPLDVLGAESQAEIGYMLQQALASSLVAPVATVVTQTVVSASDPAFENPSKPIGPFMLAPAARALQAQGVTVARDEIRGGWRRVVPSPLPLRFVEADVIRGLVDGGVVPIAAGGGGVPVIEQEGGYRGVEAVVDKDLAAALLVRSLSAELLMILTDVEHVFVERGKPGERSIGRLSVDDARAYLDAGEFGAGSMAPKVLAAVDAVSSGARAIITSMEAAVDAFDGNAGTEVVP